ncbi:BamA/TamA family outer membrane protein [Vibrio breoganii]|uniref:BamA/TamA family outer membrane protein n=1 Tax=Vibrio breoganii TaxID=553239 RepID=UPI000C8307A4|nr:BamA/TamA family outer membrane protein [Vibrio breoganii]PMG02266.1 glyceraldehyde-3-phosphate dehydrogenase [Vibrio breoganii]PMG92918.1 glyceraldehyde-3-phosphate dehydrogenase [Vibrio breoganii]PMG95853.1 glyceraldehyde-3-phosphate dehydrogenase [Vibrio breoganii]PMJ47154.1 glyceraldehyde-3-phosphate dehydrogenase [Vibrio breoganii]PMK61593.1 glyceraldehyde-3-phosphate dehydrogenase [Vibrio breoganii]
MCKPIRQLSYLLALSGSVFNTAHAVSFTDPVDGMFDMGEYLAENAYGFLPIPVIITEPAVGYGFGVIGMFLHETEEQKEKRRKLAMESIDGGAQLIPPAVTVAGGAATENGTWFALLGHRRVWKQDSIRYMGGVGFGTAIMDFYPSITPNKGVEIETKGFGGMQKLQFRLPETKLFLGVQQFYSRSEVSPNLFDSAPGLIFPVKTKSSGLGFNLEYDAKNSFFYPTEGWDFIAEYLWYREGIGSDNDYETFLASSTAYVPIANNWTLAFAVEYNSLTTDETTLPPLAYPDISLRGIPVNRYQGNYTSSYQTQVMWQFTPRWSVSVFGGVGGNSGVGRSNEGASAMFDDMKWAYGTGFRYLIARRYGVHMGMDFGFSEEDSAFYFNVGTGL